MFWLLSVPALNCYLAVGTLPWLRRIMGGIAQQLREIQGRLNYLETRMADLDPQGSQRVLDRCTELEGLMREHCNKVFAIMKSNGTEILKTMERADQLVKVAEGKCESLKANLSQRADIERQETRNLLTQLKTTIEGVDGQASNRILELEARFQLLGSQLLTIETEMANMTSLCERAEAATAGAQAARAEATTAAADASRACKRQLAEWSTPNELKAQACLRARSVQPDSSEMRWIVHLAQEAASLSPTRLQARRSLSRPRPQPNRGRSPVEAVPVLQCQPRGCSRGPASLSMRPEVAAHAAETLTAAVRARASLGGSSSQVGSYQ